MKVFLSWSGAKSRDVALALRDWLPSVINEIEPFVSAKDITAGTRWQVEIGHELEATNFGIVCVTSENQNSTWLNFEAGALAKAIGSGRLVPLALDLKVTDVKLPLAQFQAQPSSKDGILEVLKSLNAHCVRPLTEERLIDACNVWWDRLESQLHRIQTSHPHGIHDDPPERTERDLLEEILISVRGLQAPQPVSQDEATHLAEWRRAGAFREMTTVISRLVPGDAEAILSFGGESRHLRIETDEPLTREVQLAVESLADVNEASVAFVVRGQGPRLLGNEGPSGAG